MRVSLLSLLPLVAPHAHHHLRHLQGVDDHKDCSTAEATYDEMRLMADAMAEYQLTAARSEFAATIPVRFHLIKDTASNNDVSNADLEAHIAFLNHEFPGFTFVNVETKVTVNAEWYQHCNKKETINDSYDRYTYLEMNEALGSSRIDVMDVYFCQVSPTSGCSGFAYYPYNPASKYSGVAVQSTASLFKCTRAQMSGLITHEVGHWLSLRHTHSFTTQNEDKTCTERQVTFGTVAGLITFAGDGIADTPMHILGSQDCNAPNECTNVGGIKPNNHMSYSNCEQEVFTPDQVTAMQAAYNKFRLPADGPTDICAEFGVNCDGQPMPSPTRPPTRGPSPNPTRGPSPNPTRAPSPRPNPAPQTLQPSIDEEEDGCTTRALLGGCK